MGNTGAGKFCDINHVSVKKKERKETLLQSFSDGCKCLYQDSWFDEAPVTFQLNNSLLNHNLNNLNLNLILAMFICLIII